MAVALAAKASATIALVCLVAISMTLASCSHHLGSRIEPIADTVDEGASTARRARRSVWGCTVPLLRVPSAFAHCPDQVAARVSHTAHRSSPSSVSLVPTHSTNIRSTSVPKS